MSAEGIIEKIRRQSQERIREIARSGRTDAENRYNEILDQAQKEVNELTAKAEKNAQELFETSRLSATLEVRKNSLTAKRNLMNEAFERALEKMQNADERDRTAFYEDLVMQSVPREGATITVNARDRSMVQKCLSGWIAELTQRYGSPVTLALNPEDGKFKGGLFFECDTYDIDATFERILQDVRDDHEIEVAQCLFGMEE